MDKKRETMYKTHVDGNLIFNSNGISMEKGYHF